MIDWPDMLDDLKEALDEIEESNDWEWRFIGNMLSLRESNAAWKPYPRQLDKIEQIHAKYCR